MEGPTPRQREAFLLRCAGKKYTEIGDIMGVTAERARHLAHRGARWIAQLQDHPDHQWALQHFPEYSPNYKGRQHG